MIRILFHEIRNHIRNLRDYPIVTYEENILKTKKLMITTMVMEVVIKTRACSSLKNDGLLLFQIVRRWKYLH